MTEQRLTFLADESCDFAVVRTLRACGHDVLAVVEDSPGASDYQVLKRAVNEKRIILTEDNPVTGVTSSYVIRDKDVG
ncbi:MAG: DUF5615 family PIN-like protein [Deltaproteobacteria bacterium]|nr:DUF5615 family PIN-like protein [Deltaproteobacteria bacterium]